VFLKKYLSSKCKAGLLKVSKAKSTVLHIRCVHCIENSSHVKVLADLEQALRDNSAQITEVDKKLLDLQIVMKHMKTISANIFHKVKSCDR
jgi:hypothetical protein